MEGLPEPGPGPGPLLDPLQELGRRVQHKGEAGGWKDRVLVPTQLCDLGDVSSLLWVSEV